MDGDGNTTETLPVDQRGTGFARIFGGRVDIGAFEVQPTGNPNPWIVKNSGTLFPDFNNDGKTDVFWRNSTTGENAVWLMNGASISGGAFLSNLGPAWTRTTGDFNGDSRTDILLRNYPQETMLFG
ncbi:MAG: VCBS repeat-containing protein [Richelia sp. SM1_7_0]|nr:VCBS repeat-containing protein [Richelia sp. SM1_7_0]